MYHLATIHTSPEISEMLVAELSELGYEAFVEADEGLLAYVPTELFSADSLRALQERYNFSYVTEAVEQQNWNAEWEASYEPVIVAGKCLIKSSFHKIAEDYPFVIEINPKMSFGTGHHETTTLMLEHLLDMDTAGKAVLDAGCGTGILAILAYKKGAATAEGFDIEEWAVENALENAELNKCPQLKIWQGTIERVSPENRYDVLIVNIQRNVLLAEMPIYAQHLRSGGDLLLSGFYQKDVEDLLACAALYKLAYVSQKTKNDWVALRLVKNV